MLTFVCKRIVSAMLLAVFVSMLSFMLLFAAGDPATALAGQAGSAADAARTRTVLGLDQPLAVQYWRWATKAVTGDLGMSLRFDQPVSKMVVDSFRVTFIVGALAMSVALTSALLLGVLAARNPGSRFDRLVLMISVSAQSMPTFCTALLGIVLFSVHWPLLPSSGFEGLASLILPVSTLAIFALPGVLKLTRAGMIEVLSQDHIRTARAMGINERRVLFVYALRNALLPVVVVAAAQFGFLLSGSIVVESVLAIYGAGRLSLDSVLGGDIPLLQALVLSFSLIYIVVTLIADLLVAWLDPRVHG